MIDWKAESATCVELLRDLIRVPTVNRGTSDAGDANERVACELLADHLSKHGVDAKIVEKKKGRGNLIARVKGTGKKPPLLLNAHLDVVEADAGAWKHDPFSAEIHDGYVWGRGAIDMKHMAAMSTCALALLKRREEPLDRDVIFAAVADEENGCALGSSYLVDDHADEIRAEYMLGEIGAFSLHLFGKTFYPVQVAEKGVCWVRAEYRGAPGHGSMPDPESAVLKLARAIERLGRARLPMHPTAVVRGFVEGLAKELPVPHKHVLKRLTTPQVAALILDYLIRDPSQRRSFGALLSNTASPTVMRAGSKVNVIPGRASIEIDGRTLPGQTQEAFLAELRDALGDAPASLEVIHSLPAVEASPATPLFEHLAATLRRNDPTGTPLPYMIPGFTDAKAYARLGTICYGFAPVRFDPTHEISFSAMYHGHDERVPVEGLGWGLRVLFEAISGFRA
ncbi:MAG: M20/M25/M40 family metallo-hydrolase [Labilithrix sp.]|nr:M20/M25/M40 family metallo-hydrolase [Labilithrix sp.]MCW5810540.1 M20/M25/M40 family metallo-hydrolase [Labilithrix sp.]